MAWTKLASVILAANDDATESNKQPHMKGSFELKESMSQGEKIHIAIWLKKSGSNVTSGSINVSKFDKDDEYGGG